MKHDNLWDISNALFLDPSTGLFEQLKSVGGWRGLFDSSADEFQTGTIEEKAICIKAITTFNKCCLNELIELFIKEYNHRDYNYILSAIPYAIYMYSIYSWEAKLVLLERTKLEQPKDVMKWRVWVTESIEDKRINRRIDEPFEQSQWVNLVLQH